MSTTCKGSNFDDFLKPFPIMEATLYKFLVYFRNFSRLSYFFSEMNLVRAIFNLLK